MHKAFLYRKTKNELPRPPLRSRRGIPSGQVPFLPASSPPYQAGYSRSENKTLRCQLCAHRCLINPGHRGICSVRENRDGILYSLVYGLVIATHVDPIEKKPLFHFLPGTKSFSIATAGCNFRCEFCQNWDISQISKGPKGQIFGQKLPPEEVVRQAVETHCQSIAYTYTEPTVFFEYAYDTARLAKEKGLKNVFVSNGYQTKETIGMMKGTIDAINVDLKSYSEKFYQKVCGARLKPVLESIENFFRAGIHLEITTLLIPGQNDTEKEITQIAKFIRNISIEIPWHISRFHPDFKLTNTLPTPLETMEAAYSIGKKIGLEFVYLGNVLTETGENTYCPACHSLCIKRQGYQTQVLAVDSKGYCLNCGQNLHLML